MERLADRMCSKVLGNPRLRDESTEVDSEFPETSLVWENEVFQRVTHVLNGLRDLLPPQMDGTKQVAILTEIMRGMQRDISLVPPDEVKNFMRAISEATAWIADGAMADLELEMDNAGLSEDSAEEG